jgi:hypothetical protein
MSDEPRTTYETQWYDEPCVCCSRCHFVQFEGESSHAVWCTDAAPARRVATNAGGGAL